MSDDRTMSASSPVPDVPGLFVMRLIASDSVSQVWRARTLAGGEPRAVRITWTTGRPAGPGGGARDGAPDGARDGADEAAVAVSRERLVLDQLGSDHVLKLYDAIPIEFQGRRAIAQVLDLAGGGSLEGVVAAKSALSPGEVVSALGPIVGVLARMHAAGLAHGALTAESVQFARDGKPMLSDFTSARFVDRDAGPRPPTSGFTAPEVLAGGPVSAAADVYAVGGLIWFARSGQPPPRTPLRLTAATTTAHVGPELADVVASCLDPDPAARPSAAALARDLERTTPAERVDVVAGDDALLLTRRLREEQSKGGSRSHTPERRAVPRAVVLVPLVAVLLAVGIVAGNLIANALGLGGNRPPTNPTASSSPAVATKQATSTAPATSDPPATSSPGTTQQPAGDDAVVVLTQLAAGRAEALTARDVTALGHVVAPGSPLYAGDSATIVSMTKAAQRYQGLGFLVRSAAWASQDSTHAVIRAVVDTSAYRVVTTDAAGRDTTQSHPGRAGTSLAYGLVRTSTGNWRLETVGRPAD